MKLYAKTTSERASKGQGGNKQVVVDLLIQQVGENLEIGRVVMKVEDNAYSIYYFPINENCTDQKINSGNVLLYQAPIKGKKQKTGKASFHNPSTDNS